MKKQKLLLITVLLIFSFRSFSQNFLITEPKLEWDGNKLTIIYDLIGKGQSDIFSVWVEIRDQDNRPVKAYSFKGEVGDSVKAGSNKMITWVPDEDAIYLDEDVSVELKGEKYVKSFNRGSLLLMSTIVPGLGQTKITKGKPWWLATIPAYGTLAGGFIFNKKYADTYNAYLKSTDTDERSTLYDKSKKEKTLSGALFITSGVIWISNIVWVAATPNNYRPMQHTKVSVNSVLFNQERITMLSFKVNF